uniref:Uncharacterized protein n=1 Tax=Oryza barthii TaxID=65489 RepID=A0A0D3F2J5_9ORYZ
MHRVISPSRFHPAVHQHAWLRKTLSERVSPIPHFPNPHPCYSQISNPHPKILATSVPKIFAAGRHRSLPTEQASSATAALSLSQPATVVASSPYLSATQCRFVVVEPAVPLPSVGATVLCHLPAEPTAAAVFSWSHRLPLPPTHLVHGHLLASRGCCSSAPPRLSSAHDTFWSRISMFLFHCYSVPNWLHGDTNEKNEGVNYHESAKFFSLKKRTHLSTVTPFVIMSTSYIQIILVIV